MAIKKDVSAEIEGMWIEAQRQKRARALAVDRAELPAAEPGADDSTGLAMALATMGIALAIALTIILIAGYVLVSFGGDPLEMLADMTG